MKNIFVKNDNKGVWLGVLIAAGAIATAAVTCLYFNNTAAREDNEPEEDDHSMDYLVVPQKKKHKTDLHELHTVVTH